MVPLRPSGSGVPARRAGLALDEQVGLHVALTLDEHGAAVREVVVRRQPARRVLRHLDAARDARRVHPARHVHLRAQQRSCNARCLSPHDI